ncbi:hypothetical protein Dsin_006606 [Dipteronia sinensis]|uniref:Uncharacterized protein n=1 Tax=Dipteronia sinensis TaxID=43782 RepID=A0AAE0B071_9ROSI|nr:hypothetical protein Dsin_006606 [Dipteronia sinensis]
MLVCTFRSNFLDTDYILDGHARKCPISVVTDGDKAMHKVIKLVMRGSIHRLCSWQLERNVQTNIGDSGFTQTFTHCMFTYIEIFNGLRFWKLLGCRTMIK